MGQRYSGGSGFVIGAPRHDVTDAQFAALPPEVAEAMKASGFYTPCDDSEVVEPRASWRTTEPKAGRLLIVCPTLRLEPETVAGIFGQSWSGPVDYYFTKDNPYSAEVQHGYQNIAHNLKKARAVFLAGSYDALVVIESDIVAPPFALDRLARIDADIVGGLYVMRHGQPTANAFTYVKGQSDPGGPMLTRDLAANDGQVVQANGVCMGCVLIHRHVVEALPFRMHHTAAPDWAFMQDANAAGFVTVCDLSVKCGHKRPDGVTLYPLADGGWMQL